MKPLKPVAIVGGLRIPFAKSMAQYSRTTNQQLITPVLEAIVSKYGLKNQILGDVAIGALIKNSNDWNLAREAVLGSGLHPNTPAYGVQRACGTSLDTSAQIALKIAAGQIEAGIAGGTDTNSDAPVTFSRETAWKLIDLNKASSFGERLAALAKFGPGDLKPVLPRVVEPRTGLSMGEHCELMVKEWNITREDQDRLAFESHQKAAKAYASGFFDDMIVPFKGLSKDTIVRGDTTLEKLAKLKPAFDKTSGKGTLTAGNSTPLTDGAAAVLLSSEEWATERKLPVLAHFVDAQVAALDYVHGEGLLMAPALAVAQLLKRNNLRLQDFDYYEIHEAFAGQVLCTLKAWTDPKYSREKLGLDKPLGEIDPAKMNVNGSSLAVGHPFAATGARIIATAAKILNANGKGRALISICTAGGMGVAAIIEK